MFFGEGHMIKYIQPEEILNAQRDVNKGGNATETGKEEVLSTCQQ